MDSEKPVEDQTVANKQNTILMIALIAAGVVVALVVALVAIKEQKSATTAQPPVALPELSLAQAEQLFAIELEQQVGAEAKKQLASDFIQTYPESMLAHQELAANNLILWRSKVANDGVPSELLAETIQKLSILLEETAPLDTPQTTYLGAQYRVPRLIDELATAYRLSSSSSEGIEYFNTLKGKRIITPQLERQYNPIAHITFQQGQFYDTLGDATTARKYYEEAISFGDVYPHYHNTFALIARQGFIDAIDPDLALVRSYSEQGLALNPEHNFSHVLMAEYELYEGRYAAAIARLKGRDCVACLHMMGEALLQKYINDGDEQSLVDAVTALTEVLVRNQMLSKVYISLGTAYRLQGNEAAAMATWQKGRATLPYENEYPGWHKAAIAERFDRVFADPDKIITNIR